MLRTAELVIDGRPVAGSAQVVGPIPAGGRAPLSFQTSLTAPGSHLLTVRLDGVDALPGDDESDIPIEVAPAVPVLLVDGEPGSEPFSGETDFLRAALVPNGDDTPQVRARVLAPAQLVPDALKNRRVVVLANVDRLTSDQIAALGGFVEAGGGLLVAPGDRTDAPSLSAIGWMPARLGDRKGDASQRADDRPPRAPDVCGSAHGAVRPGGRAPARRGRFLRLPDADPGAGRLGLGAAGHRRSLGRRAPWGRGRVLMLATPIDAEAGTLPANPDFVPLTHEWVFHLAGSSGRSPVVRAGEPLIFPLDPSPAPGIDTLPLETPDGGSARAKVLRSGGSAHARFGDTRQAGVYRLTLPDPPGALAYAAVTGDGRESDLSPLDPAEAARLAEGWPLAFETNPDRLATRLSAAESGGRHEVWRLLVLAALGFLCVEVYLTRRIVRGQGRESNSPP